MVTRVRQGQRAKIRADTTPGMRDASDLLQRERLLFSNSGNLSLQRRLLLSVLMGEEKRNVRAVDSAR